MIRVVAWHDVPQPVRRVGFAAMAAGALVTVVGLAVLLVAAAALHIARVGGL